ncbi:hypothetical protein AA631_001514 [Enterobacter hormaechei]|nr:hypothetical protein [Enterobacter hormaechei]
MITLTKEWLMKTIAELEEERDATPGVVNEDAAMAIAAMKLAMASLEAEPVSFNALRDAVAEVSGGPAMEWSDIYKGHQAVPFINFNSLARIVEKFRTATPAPVAVPDEYVAAVPTPTNLGYEAGGNACRAAMLQGAEPVTTAYKLPFEQWLSQQTGTIDVECGCVMTEVFFHWLRVAYEAGNSPVIPDGWVLVPEEPTHEMLEAGDEQFGTYDVYRRMIAAAPQWKVK